MLDIFPQWHKIQDVPVSSLFKIVRDAQVCARWKEGRNEKTKNLKGWSKNVSICRRYDYLETYKY